MEENFNDFVAITNKVDLPMLSFTVCYRHSSSKLSQQNEASNSSESVDYLWRFVKAEYLFGNMRKPGRNYNYILIGFWSKSTGFMKTKFELIFQRVTNFHQQEVILLSHWQSVSCYLL